MDIHILFSRNTPRSTVPAEYIYSPDKMLLTDCCTRRVRANECNATFKCQELPVGGYGDYQRKNFDGKPETYLDSLFYEDPSMDVVCSEGFGCTVNKRLKCGASGRRNFIWGY